MGRVIDVMNLEPILPVHTGQLFKRRIADRHVQPGRPSTASQFATMMIRFFAAVGFLLLMTLFGLASSGAKICQDTVALGAEVTKLRHGATQQENLMQDALRRKDEQIAAMDTLMQTKTSKIQQLS